MIIILKNGTKVPTGKVTFGYMIIVCHNSLTGENETIDIDFVDEILDKEIQYDDYTAEKQILAEQGEDIDDYH